MDMNVFIGIIEDMRDKGIDVSGYSLKDIKVIYDACIRK